MLTSTLLLTTLLTSPCAQQDELAELEMMLVEVRVPGAGTTTAYRGMLRVPIVRADPKSKPIGIDVWRFPAAEGVPADRLPIFKLNGGPGWPGMNPGNVDWAEEIAPIVAHGDLVIVGQRGIGTSEPNTACSDYFEPIDLGLPIAERAALLQEQLEMCRNFWEGEEYDITGFNVIEAAGDVNDVRRLLGYDKIVLMGGSFGSHWGMTVMRYHPDIVARAVLHGMEGPDHTYDSPGGLLEALGSIASQAEASTSLEGRLPEKGLVEALRTVILDVEKEPFEVPLGGRSVPVDADALRELAKGYTCNVASRGSVGGWPADVMRLVEGDFLAAARAIDAERQGPGGGLPTASFFLLDCGSGITKARHERYLNDPAVEVFGNPSWFYDVACPVWDVDLGDDFRADFRTSIPTLMVHGTWDVSTPFSNAIELVPCFEDLHFVPVEGGTHGALREAMQYDGTFDQAVMAFVATGATEGLPKSIVLPPIEWSTDW